MRVLFLHPDLGIGGAERLVCDAALALQKKGHKVSFITTYHDPGHCFPETRDGTFPVTVAANWFPRSIFGLCRALCMYLRMILAALYVCFFSSQKIDVIFVDQVSHCVPILKTFSKCKVLFYCHYPDQLLSKPGGFIKRFYRRPLDWFEEVSTGAADEILVNSNFTKNVFRDTFRSLKDSKVDVLYPPLDSSKFKESDVKPEKVRLPEVALLISSINRYERKKGLSVAIESLALIKDRNPSRRVHFIHAGGYDPRNSENVEHFEELQKLAAELNLKEGLDGDYQFIRDLSNSDKVYLLQKTDVNLYTPIGEHFGIVPLEAMSCGTAVIAMASGGPLETVRDQNTGLLIPSPFSKVEMARILEKMIEDESLPAKLGQAGPKHVEENFSFSAFTDKLDSILNSL